MSKAEFDSHAQNYVDLHKLNIALSGEEPEYFAAYKMRDFKALVCEENLPLDGNYLDFGSGVGTSVRHFCELLPEAKLICADVSADSLAISQATHGCLADYALISNETLPFPDHSFDGAFACCVFHHIAPAQHEHVLAEIRRVIKPNGILMIYEHNPYNPLTVHAVRTCPFDENAILISATKLQKICERAGLKKCRYSYRVFFPSSLSNLRFLENGLRWLPLGAQYFLVGQA